VGIVLAGISALSVWRAHVLRAEVVGAFAGVLIVLALVRPALLARPAAAGAHPVRPREKSIREEI
jgi:hypothetical protein